MRLIEVFSEDNGRTGKLTVWPGETGYFFQTQPEYLEGALDQEIVRQFIGSLALPNVSEEDGLRDDWPCRVTGTRPCLLVRLTHENNQRSWLLSCSDSIYMLPLAKLAAIGEEPAKTYDRNLSLALAALLPEGFMNREILKRECEWRERNYARKAERSATPGRTLEDILADACQQRDDPARRLKLPIENDEMLVLLNQGAPPDAARDSSGETALMRAVGKSDVERVGILLQAGADPNAVDAGGRISLHLARDYDVAMTLISAGAEINRPDQNGRTPLMTAVSSGKTELVELLLLSGAKLEHADGRGRTALTVAAVRTDVEMVLLLLRFGASKEPARAVAQYAVRNAKVKKENNEAWLELISEEDRIRRYEESVQILGEKLSAELDQEFNEDLVLARCLEVEKFLS